MTISSGRRLSARIPSSISHLLSPPLSYSVRNTQLKCFHGAKQHIQPAQPGGTTSHPSTGGSQRDDRAHTGFHKLAPVMQLIFDVRELLEQPFHYSCNTVFVAMVGAQHPLAGRAPGRITLPGLSVAVDAAALIAHGKQAIPLKVSFLAPSVPQTPPSICVVTICTAATGRIATSATVGTSSADRAWCSHKYAESTP